MKITIRKSVGYRGHTGNKSWVAQVVGVDSQFGLAREFCATEAVDAAECFHARRKGKGAWNEAADVGPGLYEVCQHGERSFRVVWATAAGTSKWSACDDERARQIAVRLSAGEDFDTARRATSDDPAIRATVLTAQQEGR